MSTLALQRCLHHPTREAIARCPECEQFYCRECITEHDERIVCATCLAKLTRPAEAPRARLRIAALWPFASALSGLLVAWLCFYIVGRVLLALPSEFHAKALWKNSIFNPSRVDDE